MTLLGLSYPIVEGALGYMPVSKGIDVLKSDIIQLLMTNPGERVMMPSFGCPLRKYLFSKNDSITFNDIKAAIIQAINTWDPRILLKNLTIDNAGDLYRAGLLTSVLNSSSEEDIASLDYTAYIVMEIYNPEEINVIERLEIKLPLGN